MKAIIQIMLIALGTLFNMAGERSLEEHFNTRGKEILELELKFADEIHLSTWDKNEVMLKARVNINENEDNEHFTIRTEESGNILRVIEEIEDMKELAKNTYVVKQGKDGKSTVSCNSVEMEIYYEIMMPASMELKLETISGDIIVHEYIQTSKIKTISGFIDFSVAANSDADFELETITGEMYTNLDLSIEGEDDELMHVGGQEVEARLNRGGKKIHLETISGNIYLREKK